MKRVPWRKGWVRIAAAGAAALLLAWGEGALADQPTVTVTVDENGNGTADSVTLSLFNGLGNICNGQPCLAYDLTPVGASGSMTSGGVLLLEPGCTGVLTSCISDAIAFASITQDDTKIPLLIFFSDNSDGVDALADVGIPDLSGIVGSILGCGQVSGNTSNVCFINEVGPEGNNGAIYNPTNHTGQGAFEDPGFFNGRTLTYNFTSDAPTGGLVPEPATVVLLGIGLAALGLGRWRLRT